MNASNLAMNASNLAMNASNLAMKVLHGLEGPVSEPEHQISLMKSNPSLMFHTWALKVLFNPNLRLTRPENSHECL